MHILSSGHLVSNHNCVAVTILEPAQFYVHKAISIFLWFAAPRPVRASQNEMLIRLQRGPISLAERPKQL
jgi:hypothetical protein